MSDRSAIREQKCTASASPRRDNLQEPRLNVIIEALDNCDNMIRIPHDEI